MEKTLLMFILIMVSKTQSLDNGLARTPPMGWLSWERYRCITDCTLYPDECISDKLFRRIADLMVSGGYKAAGYEYVIIDDCWLNKTRTPDGYLQPDSDRFPYGIKNLADYIHSKGLKFGIYEDFGTKTCTGYPGSEYYLQRDAETFAKWGVDYVKLDGCYSDISQYSEAYPAMGFWLNQTGRPMLYSCSWPAYQEASNIKPDYHRIAKYCNIWRNFNDIQDSWSSLVRIIDFYGNDTTKFREVAQPGSFNDPDMLLLGNYGLSYDEQRVQMALWSIMASPLIMSTDLENINSRSKDLLLNANVISINQDPRGIQGQRIYKANGMEVWSRPLTGENAYAFAYLNLKDNGNPSPMSFRLQDMFSIESGQKYDIMDVFSAKHIATLDPAEKFTAIVNPSGVFFGKISPAKNVNRFKVV